MLCCFFSSRRRHTRLQGDWSSDVCSSDLDFGIARFHKAGKVRDTEAFGTAGYAPPEQYGKGQTDQRSDIYALAATLHHRSEERRVGKERKSRGRTNDTDTTTTEIAV